MAPGSEGITNAGTHEDFTVVCMVSYRVLVPTWMPVFRVVLQETTTTTYKTNLKRNRKLHHLCGFA
jgi:hypothetical protein